MLYNLLNTQRKKVAFTCVCAQPVQSSSFIIGSCFEKILVKPAEMENVPLNTFGVQGSRKMTWGSDRF